MLTRPKSLALHSRWWLLLKIEISLIVYCCFIISKNELKFYLQQHGNFLLADLYRLCIFWGGKNHLNIFYSETWPEMIFDPGWLPCLLADILDGKKKMNLLKKIMWNLEVILKTRCTCRWWQVPESLKWNIFFFF